MAQNNLEKRLTIIYALCIVAGAIASITTGVAWGHWKQTLDQCIGRNCSCILYAKHTPSIFLGGNLSSCIWITFGPLFHILFAVCMICFHGYRVLFLSNQRRTRTVMAKDENGEVVEVRAIQTDETSNLPKCYWIIVAGFTVFFTIYCLIHFSIFLDGFYYTCNQYRRTLERLLGIHGQAIPVIHGRLSCQAIFDFMDYMQPDSGNSFRDGFINTGLDLILGIVGSISAVVLYANASFINIRLARDKS